MNPRCLRVGNMLDAISSADSLFGIRRAVCCLFMLGRDIPLGAADFSDRRSDTAVSASVL